MTWKPKQTKIVSQCQVPWQGKEPMSRSQYLLHEESHITSTLLEPLLWLSKEHVSKTCKPPLIWMDIKSNRCTAMKRGGRLADRLKWPYYKTCDNRNCKQWCAAGDTHFLLRSPGLFRALLSLLIRGNTQTGGKACNTNALLQAYGVKLKWIWPCTWKCC